MNLSKSQIKDIVIELEIGMVCFIHKDTGEMISYPDELRIPFFEEELWEELIKKVEDNEDKYIRIEGMDSHDSFKVMERFAENVDDKEIQRRLFHALDRPKPFHNFKNEIDYYDEYRKMWFEFKEKETIEWVKKELEQAVREYDENKDDEIEL